MRRDYKMKIRLEDSRGQGKIGQNKARQDKARQNSGKDNIIWHMVWHGMRSDEWAGGWFYVD